jgi:hypothetical protein
LRKLLKPYDRADIVYVASQVSVAEMKELYKEQMSRPKGAAKAVYDTILNSTPYQKCPLCGQGTVTTIDHHLPQSKYPEFTVLPLNLVPACKDCNTAKHARFPRSSEEQTIHPYYDDFSNDCWLCAKVVQGGPPVLVFYANAPDNWDPIDRMRVANHFRFLKLGILFSSNAGSEMINIRAKIKDIFDAGGKFELAKHLQEKATDHSKVYLNSWQAATYYALSVDDWFCSGGFNDIPLPIK